MTTTLPTILISGASEELTARIVQLIRSQAELLLVKNLSPAEAASQTLNAKLVWVELESDPTNNIALLEQLIKSNPNTFFVVSKEDLEPELVKKAMQVGALDFLDHKGWAAQIRSVIRRIMAKEFGTKPAGGPAASIPRQPPRASSWGQLSSINKPAAGAGFRRVEPNRQVPTSTPPPLPVAQAPVEEPPLEPEIVEEPVYEEPPQESYSEEESQQYAPESVDEESAEYAQPDEQGYEGEPVYNEEAGYSQEEYQQGYGEGEYAVEEGAAEEGYTGEQYAEGQEYAGQEYSEQQYSEEQYGEQQEYAGQEYAGEANAEQEYAEQGYSEQGYAEQEYAGEGEYAAEQGYEGAEYPYEQQEGYTEDQAADTTFSANDADLRSIIRQEPTTSPSPTSTRSGMAPGRGSWGELDSIISKEAPEKKAHWGDLDKIAKAKSTEKEPAATPAPPAEGLGKWGDLDKIAGSNTAAESKWGALDSLPSPKSQTNDAGTQSEEPTKASSKWGELDSLSSKKSTSNWDDLDSITAPSAGGSFKPSSTQSILKSKIQRLEKLQPVAEPEPEPADSEVSDLDGLIGTNTRSNFGDLDGNIGTAGGDNRWGDLDSLGKGDANRTALEATNYGEAEAAKTAEPPKSSSTSAFKNRFGKKTQTFDQPEIPQEESLKPEAPGKKWGNLDAIPTPGKAADGGNWGNLDAIPTPGTAKDPQVGWGNLDSIPTPKASDRPTLVEGALPSAQVVSEQSQRWKAGMSSDLSTGAREFGEMRDKIKGTKFAVPKLQWKNVSWLVAASIIGAFGYLFTQFLVFPEPTYEEQQAP